MKKILAITAGCIMTATVATAANIAQQADSAYNKENYTLAIELYNKAIDAYGPSSDLYYNLGNAYYRNDRLGRAVINYERALRLNPANDDARANLKFVNSQIIDKPEDDSSLLTNTHNAVVAWQSANAWAWTAFAVFLLLTGCVALYIFSISVPVRKAGFFGGIALTVLLIYSLVVAADSAALADRNDTAVVTVPTTLLNSVPRTPKKTEKVVPIHEGTKVIIVDSVATPDDPVSPRWYEVKINNSTRAWLRGTDVEKI